MARLNATPEPPTRPGRKLGGWLLLLAALVPYGASAGSAAELQSKYAALQEPLSHNPFQRALVLNSDESAQGTQGDIYGVIDYPFEQVSTGLNNPDHWCDVLILHVNTKYCRAQQGSNGVNLKIYVGKKTPQALASTSPVDFNYSVLAATPAYFQILLAAPEGPLGTRDYRISLEAVRISNAKTFIHLTYSYATSFAGRLAMSTYLATIGQGKVGFTKDPAQADGEADFVGGVRGLVERNTMRYYLAIDSFLAATQSPPAEQLERRLQSWFTATERYPRQLHEMDRAAYLEMKRAEYQRQQTPQ